MANQVLITKLIIFPSFSSGSFSLAKTYFRRYMRITPILILPIIIMHWTPRLTTARPYSFPESFMEPCKTYWWSYLLHIQNYVNVNQLVSLARSLKHSTDNFSLSVQSGLVVSLGWLSNVPSNSVSGISHLEMERNVEPPTNNSTCGSTLSNLSRSW